jgi:hypothetical protein
MLLLPLLLPLLLLLLLLPPCQHLLCYFHLRVAAKICVPWIVGYCHRSSHYRWLLLPLIVLLLLPWTTGAATTDVNPLEMSTSFVLLSLALGCATAAAVAATATASVLLLSCKFGSPMAADTCRAMAGALATTAAVLRCCWRPV